MSRKILMPLLSVTLLLLLVLSACSTAAPAPAPANTNTPQPTATNTAVPTKTSTPTRTPRPTVTPNLALTQQIGEWQAEAQTYFDKGYLDTVDGKFKKIKDFSYEWAELGYYKKWPVGVSATDFFISGHFKWSSAYQNTDNSGCGYVFSLQENDDHYAIFLDRSKVLFAITSDHHGRIAGPTRGTGRVKFGNPAEADFTLIVKDNYAYALVNGEVVSEYTLAQSRSLTGDVALSVLSGTNKDYGTRCEMTNLHAWIPNNN
jgi:hypothetical protein